MTKGDQEGDSVRERGRRLGREDISLLLLASKWMFSQNQNQILACGKGARDQQELLNH